jgi:hypothetical protein
MQLSNSLYNRLPAIFLIGLAIAAQILAPADTKFSPSTLILPSFLYPAGWSVPIFLLIVLSGRDRIVLAAAILVCAAVGALVCAVSGSIDGIKFYCFVGAGIAPYLLMLARIAGSSGEARRWWIDTLALASMIHIAGIGGTFFRDQTAEWIPKIVDAKLAQIDEAFGAQPSAVMAAAFAALPSFRDLCRMAYQFVELPIVVVAAFHWRRQGTNGCSVLPSFFFGSILGYICYFMTPAIGPRAYFGEAFPLLHAGSIYLAQQPLFDLNPAHSRNAMPSMHIAWAIMIFLYTRNFPIWARCYAGLFAVLTACATIGSGEHYLIDLVVALPLVVMIRALCSLELREGFPERRRAIIAGLAMVAFWLGLIRFASTVPPTVSIFLVAITIAASVSFERKLAEAEERARNLGRDSRMRVATECDYAPMATRA